MPTGNGDRYLVTAAARDSFLAIDQRPAGAYLTLDNEAPRIEQFVLQNNVQVTASDTVGIENIISDAREMRFGETLEELNNAKYQPFADQHEITLSKKPGRKRIYGQWRDSYMNATRPGEKGSIAKVIHDKDGPKVSSTFPHNRADDVNISVMITANFDEISIDELSITTETVNLKGSDGTIIPAKVVFDALSKTVSLTPFEFLTYDSFYRVVIDDAVQDRLGNNLDKDFKWTFRTIDVSDHPPDKPVHVEVVSTRYGDSITWSPPRGFDKGRDFNPPVQGGYNVYRSERRKGQFELVNKVPLTETRYIDSDYGEPGKRFYFIRAVDAGGSESEASTTKVNDKISAVFNLRSGKATTVTSANDMIRLSVPRLKKRTKISIKNTR
ncbi:MAG: Ig-like domain-containing protein, partial [Actinomycetia bacterium]|nr:Ig-like domain-containing protein [Actinomycetes bacterium]